jgi:hypothetical protein
MVARMNEFTIPEEMVLSVGKSNPITSYKLTENIIIPLDEYDINYPNHLMSKIIHRLGEEIDKLNERINELETIVDDNHSRRFEP